jgi:hypothetical protein
VDDFYKEFEPEWRKILIENQDKGLISNKKRRNRRTELSLCEAITIKAYLEGFLETKVIYRRSCF